MNTIQSARSNAKQRNGQTRAVKGLKGEEKGGKKSTEGDVMYKGSTDWEVSKQ